MAYEHKPNRGSLLKNMSKQKDTDPSWRGDGLIDLAGLGLGTGQAQVWLSIWVDQTKAGDKRLSLSIAPKQPKESDGPQQGGFDDDIPF